VVHAPPGARAQPPFDRFPGEASIERLLPCDNARLVLKLAKPSQVLLFLHAPSLNSPIGMTPSRLSACG
jgi:hypothetical protein